MWDLVEKCEATEPDADLTLSFERRQKSRQRVRLDNGQEATIVLPPGTALADGDHLRSIDGQVVRVRAEAEPVSLVAADDPVSLARACYHLGNRHVALQIGEGWLSYQPDHVLDEMIEGLGLKVVHESRPFRPERGAYGGHRHAQGESSGDAHRHAHGHAHGK